MPISEAQKRAKAKYDKKSYDQIMTRVKKGKKQFVKDFAEANGESLNALMIRLLKTEIQSKTGKCVEL